MEADQMQSGPWHQRRQPLHELLRNLVNATIGFEQLACRTEKPSKSLHRMLSPTGNPSMDNLAAIFHAIREGLNVNLEAHCIAA